MLDNERLRQLQNLAPASGIGAVVLLILVGNFLFDQPFHSSRPLTSKFTIGQDPERIDARLWEDPFLALDRQGSREASQRHRALSQLLNKILPDAQAPKGRFLFLVLPHDQERTSEASEFRRRQRIAVVSALSRRGLLPVDGGHLYPTRLSNPSWGRKADIAYELFDYQVLSDDTRSARRDGSEDLPLRGAAVVWIEESILRDLQIFLSGFEDPTSPSRGSAMVLRIASLLAHLLDEAGKKPYLPTDFNPEAESSAVPTDNSLKFAVIGPWSSSSLTEFTRETQRQSSLIVQESLPGGSNVEPVARPVSPVRFSEFALEYLDETPPHDCLQVIEALDNKADQVGAVSQDSLLRFRSEVESVLEAVEIEDSDPSWEETISGHFTLSHGFTLLGLSSPDAAIKHTRRELEEMANFYLDRGLNHSLDEEQLSTATKTFFNRSEELEALEKFRTTCEGHPDSDLDWISNVVGLWRWQLGTLNTSEKSSSTTESHEPPRTPWIRQIQQDIQVYSSLATVPLGLTRLVDQAQMGSLDQVQSEDWPPWVHTVTSSDQQLAAAMFDELNRRGLRFPEQTRSLSYKNHLVLISEGDTPYGRSLPFVFETELRRRARCEKAILEPEESSEDCDLNPASYLDDYKDLLQGEATPPNVHRFTYLRGLDGKTVGTERTVEEAVLTVLSESSNEASLTELNPRERLEAAEGPGQLDLVRRIGDQILDLNERLRAKGLGQVGAIGVLGHDYHDKLLVLQALRSRFPGTVFFTTDLDARYLQPEVYRWTANLLIASGFGLELDPTFQCWVPQFRDSYATATFGAVLAALQDIEPREENLTPCRADLTVATLQKAKPRLFEVGRDAFVPLLAGAVDHGISGELLVHPEVSASHSRWFRTSVLWALSLFAILWWISEPASHLVPRFGERRKPLDIAGFPISIQRPGDRSGARILMAAAGTALIWAVSLAALLDARRGGEPAYWLRGTSVWPSELLRLTAAMVALLLVVRVFVELRRNVLRLEDFFGSLPFAESPRRPIARVGSRSWWRSLVPRVRTRLLVPAWRCEELPAQDIWDTYRRFATPRSRLSRTFLAFLVASILLMALACTFGLPQVPARSAFARGIHWIALLLSTSSLVFLALLVRDATLLCVRLVDALGGQDHCPAFPPTEASQHFADSRGLPVAEVGDLLAIRIVAERTETVGRMLIYPFWVATLFVVARSRLFDAWQWPWSINLFLLLLLFSLLSNAVILRRSARQARHQALQRLNVRRTQLAGSRPAESSDQSTPSQGSNPTQETQPTVAQIDGMIGEIETLRRGAFTGWSASPIFGALLLTVGAATLFWLAEMVLQWGP